MRKSQSLRAAVALAAAGLLASPAADAATIYNLGDLGGGQSFGHAINASGQVTGYSHTAGDPRAFIYSGIPGSGGAMHNLGTLGENSFGHGINATGQVVGTSRTIDL